ncbi:MAG: hypothetical protein A3H57_00920 [Candidatus Taylorbacteria bacterium RIFCSPLOWO2_02_FULL_43_11]|uniref:Uncharacterized protein n=1 Tax=Candidatus Taylorbacteria bacterium RIFCSPHIGHO2_02_FULL_43_32b TaxID=1802306 RepID=A0A1G2MJE9_9BACT|nr:MAG: hypothetical protein A2743_03965 [Candidatus Taylorbacteria bacterium RIFCSPHIGHO2_01_FULL_43_47]OHA23996.1 MAG: hypothetical protein A3C72_02525 [Candidatus Taylorbacteria bacterium RIFCSPHIGHO2_02_FULL_43_32b]OHA31013.1 MAG: hypothetical protein A3B08_03030 [Candidatus Taylorbacteria bacterium RIFCSPLOWO2_01_FULL_43_44]OHA37696.1 MAG: hypothetical protein A3H57_00920 [Candidatus Taylorbacteria bacterium RIFCSPLOWO2_02_FULL_43_11]
MNKIVRFFDKLEDRIRGFLSHYPMLYAMVGGVAVVLFWRGVWELADDFEISAFWSLFVSVLIMMGTGVFVSFFIGDRIILTGLKREKKLAEKTEDEVKEEEMLLVNLSRRLENIEKSIDLIKQKL